MGVALYRKYRSKSFDEIVGQKHITDTLKSAIKQDRISHAYLLAGPRGVGKTSIARILAHAVNGLEYKENIPHLDIIEIDAASNRRIDEIRELRERVHIAPTSVKYKVYIIDEVHMLTREAFNALLKTLEEPPAHAIFILATTEAHRLPETIISRTQRFNFKPIQVSDAVEHLQRIAAAEGIKISDDALAIIAEHGEGSFRDSISLLDQVRGQDQPISADSLLTTLGVPPRHIALDLLGLAYTNDKRKLLSQLDALKFQGFQAPLIAKQLSRLIRSRLADGKGNVHDSEILRQLLEVQTSHDPDTLLEIILLTIPTLDQKFEQDNPKDDKPHPIPSTKKNADKDDLKTTKKASKDISKASTDRGKVKKEAEISEDAWKSILDNLRKKHNTLYAIVRMATFTYDGALLTLTFTFPFHHKRISEARNSKLLADVLQEFLGKQIEIKYELESTNTKLSTKEPTLIKTSDEEIINSISNIFGGAEVLE